MTWRALVDFDWMPDGQSDVTHVAAGQVFTVDDVSADRAAALVEVGVLEVLA